jgi:hypothetical protein
LTQPCQIDLQKNQFHCKSSVLRGIRRYSCTFTSLRQNTDINPATFTGLIPDSLHDARTCSVLRIINALDTIGLVDAFSEPRNECPFDSLRKTARPGGFFVPAFLQPLSLRSYYQR